MLEVLLKKYMSKKEIYNPGCGNFENWNLGNNLYESIFFYFYKFGVLRAYTNNYPIKSFRQVFGQIEWLLENFKFSSTNSMSKLRLKVSIFSKLDRLSWKLVYRVNFGRWWRKTTFEVRNQLVTWSKTPKTAKSWIFSSDDSFSKISS